MAKAATKGVAKPAAAIGTAITLWAVANVKFSLIRARARFAVSIASGNGAKSRPSSTISKAARAASKAVAGEIDT